MSSNTQMPTIKTIISAVAAAAATAMVIRSIAEDVLPREFQHYLGEKFRRLLSIFSNELTLVINEFDGLYPNHLFRSAEIYHDTIITAETKRLRVTKYEKEKHIKVRMEKNEELTDLFCGFQIKWRLLCPKIPGKSGYSYRGSTVQTEVRFFELVFHKKIKDKVIDEYLPYILERSKILKEQKKMLKLWTLKIDELEWQSVNLDHPAKFDTLAMESDAKKAIMEDLQRFVKRKEFYRRVGKAWKRGYLLFGPPGTGKSSLIAAMANYLNFDVYDLELTNIRTNSDMRNLLISMANKSILVVEDIDCSIELQDRKAAALARNPLRYNQVSSGVTLSGLFNFIDGLWSSCGVERIIIFTTNHKDRLDPALLRPGRMDVHIHMSYCTPCAFRMLAKNYLGISDHPLFLEIERLIEIKKVTPAEVGEQMMKNEEVEITLRGLITFLEEKKESEVQEVKKGEVEQKESESESVTELGKKEGGSFTKIKIKESSREKGVIIY